jgi:glycosyltransferase involved in cell wall biosynthesis
MTKISIILPVFNGEKYIKNSIESVLNQRFNDFELIIVNDGSTDSTLNIIQGFNDSRIKLITQSNQGPGKARNNALDESKGDYILFLDSDDWFTNDAFQIAYNEAIKFDTDLTFFQMLNYNDETGEFYKNDWFDLNNFDKSFENRVFKADDIKDSIFDMSVGVCQKIYKREFLKSIDAKFPEGIFFEDMPFFYYVFLKAERISIIKNHLYYRRKHNESITHIVDSKFLDTVAAGQILMKIFIENGWYEKYKFDLLAYKVNGPRFALRDLPPENKEDMFKLIKEDYELIKSSAYHKDYLENLGPVKKKFFQNILEAKDYEEFLCLNE